MKFLTEQYNPETVEVIAEERDNGQTYVIKGVFMQGNVLNGNQRIYPQDILQMATEEYVANYVNEDRAVGELGHPDNPNINLDRISHKITSLNMVGSNVHGTAEILDTKCGQIAKNLLKGGVKLGVSSRGLGSIVEDGQGRSIVQDDFVISTAADIVYDPSAPDAFVTGLMESQDWIFDGRNWRQTRHLEEMQEGLKKGGSARKARIRQEIANFIRTL